MSLESYLRAAPKAELHVHLEGSIRPATLLELARRNGASLPAETEAGLREWFVFRDFAHFVEVYVAVSRCLKTAADYELITYELGTELARQNVRYAEVTFSPSTHELVMGIPHATYFPGLVAGRERVRRELGVELHWVFDIVRNLGQPERGADYVTRVAIEGKDDGVVALGLGGLETGYPPEPFAPWFERAGAAGLHRVPHAGEIAGAPSVWGALRALGAERIGHGVRSIEDPELVAHLMARSIPLEVCPTSNVRLGVYPSLEEHPLRRLHDAGVVVTVNSDDPPLFNTTISDEVATLATAFGFTAADVEAVDAILLNAVRGAFLPA
ncbi:MAG TPA: adenosine deaminase, partial [Chloroflexota bacterium]|nr:adenosine deaminase [Chloroflexota bacterium]